MMEEDFLVFSPNDDHQHSETEAVQDSSRDLNLDRELQGHLGLEGLNQKQGQLSFSFSPDQAHVQDKDCTQEEVKQKFSPEAYLDPLEGKRLEQTLSDEGSDVSEVWPQHQDQTGHHRHPGLDLDQDQDQDQKLFCIVPDEVVESAGRVPALLITQAEEFPEPVEPQKPAVLGIPLSPTDPSLSSISDGGGDATCSDLLSLRSDSLSISSDPTTYRMSEDDDRTSVTASSVMSLFHRVQLDPLEKDWWRSSALGNVGAQRQLLSQESSLVVKKDFITTALHWAAKQGRQEVVDMMLHAGADVNARSGYTPLHLASIHGHQHVVHALINTHNAKTNIRDYHGKTAVHYWSGSTDFFIRPDSQSGGRLCQGRQRQRSILPSLLLLRSQSQEQLGLELRKSPQLTSHHMLDL